MRKPILYLYRGDHTWMVSPDIPEDEGGSAAHATAIRLLREVGVETALQPVRAGGELPFPAFTSEAYLERLRKDGGTPMGNQKSVMEFNLDEEAPLFQALKNQPPEWWRNLIEDKEIYIDIRKGSYIDAYYRGGRLLKVWYGRDGFHALIGSEYIPLREQGEQKYTFSGGDITLDKGKIRIEEVRNFCPKWLSKVKNRIKRIYPNDSEKAIQADYVLHRREHPTCCFIDTEFVVDSDARIDLVWLEASAKERAIYFVELKTIGNKEIYFEKDIRPDDEKINRQLKKYQAFLDAHEKPIRSYYGTLYRIKKNLGLLPRGWEGAEDISDCTIETKPILLVGDCLDTWIRRYSGEINGKIRECAYGAIYHGRKTTSFAVPKRTRRYEFVFSERGAEGDPSKLRRSRSAA